MRAAPVLVLGAVAACTAPVPEKLSPCSGRMALGGDLVAVNCGGLAAFELDGTPRWAAGYADAVAVPPDGDDLYYAGSFDGTSGVFAAAKATGVARPLAAFVSSSAFAVDVAVAGDQVYWIEAAGSSPAASLRRSPRAGGTMTVVASAANGMASLAGDGTAVYWVERGVTDASVLVRRLDTATDQITDLARLDGFGVTGPGLAIDGGVDVQVQNLDLAIDAYRIAPGAAPVLLAHDTRGTLAAGGGYLMAGTIRIASDGQAERILPAWRGDLYWLAIAGDDLYFTSGFGLWRRPLDGDPSPGQPSGQLGPPLVGVPP